MLTLLHPLETCINYILHFDCCHNLKQHTNSLSAMIQNNATQTSLSKQALLQLIELTPKDCHAHLRVSLLWLL